MLALLLSGLTAVFLFTVSGFWLSRMLRLTAGFTEKFLLGMAAINTAATILSLFFAVNGYVLAAMLLVCILLSPMVKRDIAAFTGTLLDKQYQFIIALLFILVGFLIALNLPNNYDTGLYHAQAIKWTEEYAVVPGLANLHGRFGFNPNIFCLFALTSFTSIFGQQIYSLNFIVFAVMVCWFIDTIYTLYRKQGVTGLLIVLLVMFYTLLQITHNLTSPSPDFLAISLTLFILARTACIVNAHRQLTLIAFVPVIILSAYIITVKLSTIPVFMLTGLLLIRHRYPAKKLAAVMAICAMIVVPWIIRNIIISGWLIYPFPSLDLFSFDWEVPLQKVAGEHESVTGWARNPGPQYAASAHMALKEWLPIWWARLFWNEKVFILAGIILPVIALGIQTVKMMRSGFVINSIIATAFGGSIFWLLTAPVYRFGLGFIVTAALSPLLVSKFYIKASYRPMLVFNVLMVVLLYSEIKTARAFIRNVMYNVSHVVVKPLSDTHARDEKFRMYKINNIDAYEPIAGDRCLDHALPCTPYPDSAVVLRGKTLQAGFMVKHIKYAR